MRTPLQIVVIRDLSDRRINAYVDTLRIAFEGSAGSAESPSAYLDDAVDLGIRVLEPKKGLRGPEAERLAGGAQHTIIVEIGNAPNRRTVLQKFIDSGNIVRVASPPATARGEVQGDRAADGVETAFAPVVTALRAMQKARRVLAHGIDDPAVAASSLKLFISHAKIDGVAMAKSLIGVLRQLREVDGERVGFAYFYDDEHLLPGVVWREALKAEAEQSVLIALRTEAYESRYWCRREFLLAESKGMPILVVDLRKEQYHDSALLPFDLVPTVRVHDGNLIRVVLHAMAAHLRKLRVRYGAPPDVKVLSHRPSVYSLDRANQLAGVNQIAYPGPKLPEAFMKAVRPLLIQGGRQMGLVTFDELGDS